MNPITNDLAQAHISEMRRYACRTRLFGIVRPSRPRRESVRVRTAVFGNHFVPVAAGLFRH